jgi:ribosome-binding factor A
MTREQLEHSLTKYLAELIPTLSDPRIPMIVTVERVRLSPDLSSARVLVSCLGDERQRRALQEALNHAGGYLQRQLAPALSARRTPKLHFYIDPAEVI